MEPSNAKDAIRLRKKKLNNGLLSLYLDIYYNGVRKYEFLKLYLRPELTKGDRSANKETLSVAESIRMKRISELQQAMMKPDGVALMKASRIPFVDFFQSVAEKKKGTTRTSWGNALAHIKIYIGNASPTLDNITPGWVRGFREYLDQEAVQWGIDDRKRNVKWMPISEGTKALMFQKLTACLNEAVRQDLLPSSPAKAVKGFSQVESEREYLILEELRRLAEVPCPAPEIGRMFLFSCLTGLRWSDVCALRWSNVLESDGGTRLVFTQKKTRALEYLDISSQAASFLGERGREDSFVFRNSMPTQTARPYISAWVRAAGINKHITFHCARHTFAILMLDLGTDIYTVSKLLGHKCLETTEVYAKILDKNKKAAVERIPNIFGKKGEQEER